MIGNLHYTNMPTRLVPPGQAKAAFTAATKNIWKPLVLQYGYERDPIFNKM